MPIFLPFFPLLRTILYPYFLSFHKSHLSIIKTTYKTSSSLVFPSVIPLWQPSPENHSQNTCFSTPFKNPSNPSNYDVSTVFRFLPNRKKRTNKSQISAHTLMQKK